MHYSKVIIAISLALIVSLIVYIFDDANVVDKEGVPASLVQRGLLHLRGLKKKKKRGRQINRVRINEVRPIRLVRIRMYLYRMSFEG